MSRKQSRELTFRLLFRLAFNTEDGDTINEELLETALLGEKKPDEAELSYINKLTGAVIANLAEIDALIKQRSDGFSFDRIFRTDLTVLRMGIAELKFLDITPPVVAVNEAVEIAKKYGTEKSGAFVNGILAAFIQN